MTAVLTNPIWVVKTRILASERSAQGAYRGFFGMKPRPFPPT